MKKDETRRWDEVLVLTEFFSREERQVGKWTKVSMEIQWILKKVQ